MSLLDKTEATTLIDIVRQVSDEYQIKSHRILNPTSPFLKSLRREAISRIFIRWPDINWQCVRDLFDLSYNSIMRIKKDSAVIKDAPLMAEEVENFAAEFFIKQGFDFKTVKLFKTVQDLRHTAILAIIEKYPDFPMAAIGRIFNMDHTSICHVRDKYAKSTERSGN